MQDYIKQPLAVDDRVVHGVGGRYGGLGGPYWVHSFSPQMVRLKRAEHHDVHFKTVPPSNLVKVAPV